MKIMLMKMVLYVLLDISQPKVPGKRVPVQRGLQVAVPRSQEKSLVRKERRTK